MSEFAGVVINDQDEDSTWDQGEGFLPFGATLNSAMVPYGMDKRTHEDARTRELGPEKIGMEGFMVFLFESETMMGVTDWALKAAGKSTETQSMSSILKEKARL